MGDSSISPPADLASANDAHDDMDNRRILKFQAFSSAPEPSFWNVLGKLKLNDLRLSEDPISIRGVYSTQHHYNHSNSGTTSGGFLIPPRIRVRGESFGRITLSSSIMKDEEDKEDWIGTNEWEAKGILINVNTVETFKTLDKKALLEKYASDLCNTILENPEEIFQDPSLLNRFLVLSFADLKKHVFAYWFAFPALVHPSIHAQYEPPAEKIPIRELNRILKGLSRIRETSLDRSGYFLLRKETCEVFPLSHWPVLLEAGAGAKEQQKVMFAKNEIAFGFIDPGSLEESDPSAGWNLRNFLYFISAALKLQSFEVYSIRETVGTSSAEYVLQESNSWIFHVYMNPAFSLKDSSHRVTAVGWELNSQGKPGPRVLDLSDQLDPIKLAESACNLNLNLMRWRAIPNLNPSIMANTKCLLLGAGTLGCSVARCLLGWGFRYLSFVDNGRVSYSNPVRQSLFRFEDCLGHGKPKAEAAAKEISAIHPGAEAFGYDMAIPMPGHIISASQRERCRADVEKLEGLIQSHDAVFLLTDTRESRWLPTLLCAKYDKITINCALGFDSYLVMRHGTTLKDHRSMGCYFCNDIVAPQDSTKDRTIDQQCTVTRPGLAPIAGAIAVELLVNLLQHPLKHRAGAASSSSSSSNEEETNVSTKLGVLPHQIRGFLPTFGTSLIQGPYFPQCTACSNIVVQAYHDGGFEFLEQIFNDPELLEKITGLADLKTSTSTFDFDDFEEEEELE